MTMRAAAAATLVVALCALATAHAFVSPQPAVLSYPRGAPTVSFSNNNAATLVMRLDRPRKRDIVRKCWGSTTSRLSIRNQKSLILRMSKKDDNTKDDNIPKDPAFLETLKTQVSCKIPPKLLEIMQLLVDKLTSLLPSIRLAALSFTFGIFLTLAAILVPIYNEVETLTEPVTLFETILGDLERAYVDPVDTTKLFETGISAMLASLDPYTEFEGKQQAMEMSESIGGRYGGVGLVISGATPKDVALMEQQQSQVLPQEMDTSVDVSTISSTLEDDDDDDGTSLQDRLDQRKYLQKARDRGIRVVSAFEGYAYDYGLRVGDKLLSIDSKDITSQTSVEEVRNLLRGQPGTQVTIEFERDGLSEIQTVTMPRAVVQIRDVKLATLMGNPQDGIGYIQLTGFASDAGREVRNAIIGLQRATELATNGERSLQGLILDMRGNPGGLLTSAVDVASLLVPKGSDIVSAKGRGFPGVLYRSRVEPILAKNTKLAVLVNGGTASAAEIVSGAVQDLDAGIIVGSDRTFGKGLVQNVEDLPFNTALKFTVAKYYTPSGRCIQGITYSEGGGLNAENGGKFKEQKVAAKDRSIFYTTSGRVVKDGGGIEADYKVSAPKASALEVTLLRSGVMGEFAAEWSKKHELTNNFQVDGKTYNEFQAFCEQKQKDGDLKLEALYSRPINDLKKILKQSGYKGSSKELEQLQASIVREVQKDFDRYQADIKEDLQQSILARYLPESMLIARSLKTDQQVIAAIKLVSNGRQFDKLLAKGSASESRIDGVVGTLNTAAANGKTEDSGARLNVKW